MRHYKLVKEIITGDVISITDKSADAAPVILIIEEPKGLHIATSKGIRLYGREQRVRVFL